MAFDARNVAGGGFRVLPGHGTQVTISLDQSNTVADMDTLPTVNRVRWCVVNFADVLHAVTSSEPFILQVGPEATLYMEAGYHKIFNHGMPTMYVFPQLKFSDTAEVVLHMRTLDERDKNKLNQILSRPVPLLLHQKDARETLYIHKPPNRDHGHVIECVLLRQIPYLWRP